MHKRVLKMVGTGAAVALAVVGWGSVAAAQGLPDPAAAAGSAAPQYTPSGSPAEQQARASQRLAANSAAPHPGTPEPVVHPEADHAGTGLSSSPNPQTQAQPSSTAGYRPGLDVSGYEGNVNWAQVASQGAAFAYVKASEGTYYTSAYFGQQYNGAYNAGLIRGAYHFAIPNNSSGAAQADFFVSHGGGWSSDGRTLPGMLDIEYNPYGSECYGLSPSQMTGWIANFDAEYANLVGRPPAIYSTTGWWSTCTGNASGFSNEPLVIANYSSSPYPLPASWSLYNFWQYAAAGTFPGDQDYFNGTQSQLVSFASGAVPSDPVQAYYEQLGGSSSYLGQPIDKPYLIPGGEQGDFQGGSIYFSSATGAHAVHGAILAHYVALGGPVSFLGFPTSDEAGTSDGGGRFNTFAGYGGVGGIVWSPATGAWSVHGAIWQHYLALGGATGLLAYPTSDEQEAVGNGGRYNTFSGAGKASVYWSFSTGAWSVHGAILAYWLYSGGAVSFAGYPVSDEYGVPGGRASDFQHATITWNASTGAITVQAR